MWRAIGCVLLLAGSAHADDPAGTQTLELFLNGTKSITAPDGSRVVCDDPSVVSVDLVDGKLQFRGSKVGTTLCGVRHPGELPGGLYRVRVVPKPPKDEKTEATGG
jgi:hypothetical protein